ncbi:MAG: hypothetical protein MRY64_09330 [Hyphomonadaceae bacterium]|nr:hypothetical protein [Hyphomonadaceae bacterium]
MANTLKLALGATALMLVAACSAHVQTTSGADYLARYESYATPSTVKPDTVDAEIREIAAIEPNLQFPARIGLARIEHGRLTGLPEPEAFVWGDLADQLGPDFGTFAPVSPLIAAMVDSTPHNSSWDTNALIADIRRGAARQHLDYVLVYEVNSQRDERANGLALADLTIIGMFVLPSRDVEVEATASAILIDVRNGYPYATLTGFAEKDGMARVVSTRSHTDALSEDAELRAVEALVDEAANAFEQLAIAAEEMKTGAP